MSRIPLSILLFAFVIVMQGVCLAGIDPYGESYGEMAYSGTGTPLLFNVPDGSGDPFTSAQLEGGSRVDVTLTLYLRNANSDPIIGFPAEDLWLEVDDSGLIPCLGGAIADAPSDQNGVTTWTAPLRAGGNSQTLTRMIINGSNLPYSPGFELNHVSPDLNGDLIVNLVDTALFAQDFATGYTFRSDFSRDMILNLSDLSYFAGAIGKGCP